MLLKNTETEKFTIRELFETPTQFAIPSYQRAYSWESDADGQVRQFIGDLEEQHPEKNYYLGHFLFEKDESEYLFVIDGQQRLTTVVIFFSCLIHELHRRFPLKQLSAKISETDLDRLRTTYLRKDGKRRFLTVESDIPFFDDRILTRSSARPGDTRSRKRIEEANSFFLNRFKAADTVSLLNWAVMVEGAVITTFQVHDKILSTQIFSFQNDRGKSMTALEKLKAYLVYQTYLNSEKDQDLETIKHVERQFSDIYTDTEQIQLLTEDQVLNHHCTAYLRNWGGALEIIKSEIKKNDTNMQRVEWVSRFSSALAESFRDVKAIESLLRHNECIADPIILDGPNAWPIILKLYNKFHDELLAHRFTRLFRVMELTLFKKYFLHGKCANDLPGYATALDLSHPEEAIKS